MSPRTPDLFPPRPGRIASDRGAVILVSLCFVAVMGIVLGSYIALCTRAMQLSNRSLQSDLSKQLAEAGVDEALRAFNRNNWTDWTSGTAPYTTSVDWDITTHAASKRAVATMTFPTGKFGQGANATVRIRVDNYDAPHVGATWSSSRNYRINDLVGHNGVWYRSVRNHSNQAPNGLATLSHWVPAPIAWTWQPNVSYRQYDMVNYDDNNDGIGTWFRCTAAHTSPATWTGTNWTVVGAIKLYSPGGTNAVGDIVYNPDTTTWYLCTAAGTPGTLVANAMISWQYRAATTYRINDVVCYYTGGSYNWYRFINGTPTAGQVPTNTTYWENALSGPVHGWASGGINYNLGDVVYYATTAQWYRCILAHTSSTSLTPSDTAYWTNTPSLSNQWTTGPYYSANDVVSHNGTWYLCILSHTSSTSTRTSNTTYWIGANTTNGSYIWNATTAYAAGAYRCYGGAWYQCLSGNIGQAPSNTTYWTATWAQSSGATTGAPIVYAQATISLGDGTVSRTQLRGLIAPVPLFANAAGATTTLNITGGVGTVDSYDSSLGTYASQVGTSTNYAAVVAAGTESATGTSTLLTIGNGAIVQGYAAAPSSSSSPYAPRASFGSSATIKSISSPIAPTVDLTQVSRSAFVPKFTPWPTPPLATAFTSANFPSGRSVPTNMSGTNNTIHLGTPGGTTPSRYYYNATLNIGSATTYDVLTLNINGPVKLYINGNLYLQSGGTVQINPGGSAEIHVDGAIRTYAGAVGFVNTTLIPKNLFLISDITATTAQQILAPTPTTNDFYGVIYAPYTTATLGMDIRTGVKVYGAISAREINFNSEANLHYDTSLRHATFSGVEQPYTVSEWRELSTTEAATMP